MTQEVICEESPAGESQSLGSVNIQARIVQGQARTLRDVVETWYRNRIDEDSMVAPWMVRHAAGILNRFRVGSDGMTVHRPVKGSRLQTDTVEFRECVCYLKPNSVGQNKADVRWEEGIWLGIRDKSGETYIGTELGVIKVRSVRRQGAMQARWVVDLLGHKYKGCLGNRHRDGKESR